MNIMETEKLGMYSGEKKWRDMLCCDLFTLRGDMPNMPKQVLICFKCKTTKPLVKVGGVTGVYRELSNKCQHCGKEMKLYNNNGLFIPKKRDEKAWKRLSRNI